MIVPWICNVLDVGVVDWGAGVDGSVGGYCVGVVVVGVVVVGGGGGDDVSGDGVVVVGVDVSDSDGVVAGVCVVVGGCVGGGA